MNFLLNSGTEMYFMENVVKKHYLCMVKKQTID